MTSVIEPHRRRRSSLERAALFGSCLIASSAAYSESSAATQFVQNYWTAPRIRSAMPLDLWIDESSGQTFVFHPQLEKRDNSSSHSGSEGRFGSNRVGAMVSYADLFVDSHVNDGVKSVQDRSDHWKFETDVVVVALDSIFKTASNRNMSTVDERDDAVRQTVLGSMTVAKKTNNYSSHLQSPHESYSSTTFSSVQQYERHHQLRRGEKRHIEHKQTEFKRDKKIHDKQSGSSNEALRRNLNHDHHQLERKTLFEERPTSLSKEFLNGGQELPQELKSKHENKDKNKHKNKQQEKNKDKEHNKNNNKNNDSNSSNKKKKLLPNIANLEPARGSKIVISNSQQQTFSARVTPSSVTEAKILEVAIRLIDPGGDISDWLSISSHSRDSDLYQITIDGFNKYEDTKWKYQLMARDQDGQEIESDIVMFRVVNKNYGDDSKSKNNDSYTSTSSLGNLLPATTVQDSDWPYSGAIQSATGRILFEFEPRRRQNQRRQQHRPPGSIINDTTFVCTGTVIDDNNTPGRSIVLTAAHCAYNDALKKFATRAVFIPDQDSTRGAQSDFDCANDKYGCWELSFALVSRGWAEGNFPGNVEYDYAFYVVEDRERGIGGTHETGYLSGMSGVLDRDVTPMPIDFDAKVITDEFTVSLGYSADKDPNFRYCANDVSMINGVSWYTNLWLDACSMTGGASGGPWTVNMDKSGRGTIISVNSWGLTDRVGMAGPELRTRSGSLAECLFEKAKAGNNPGSIGGYIVDC